MIKAVKKRFGVSSNNAARLIQTETAFFSATAKLASYKKLGYKKYVIVAALDERTSQICRDMNGEVFDLEDFKPGMVKDQKSGEMVKIPKDESYREWLDKRMKEADMPQEGNAPQGSIISLEDAPVNEPILIETITPDKVDSKLREYENSIKDNDFETAFIITGKNEVYRVKGDTVSVDWSGVSSKGAHILHNHLTDEDGYADSFGRDDYAFMQDNDDIVEMRLVTPLRRYALRLLKPLDLPGNEVYKNGANAALNAEAYGQIQRYMMLYLKELGYIDYQWEDLD